MPYTYTFQVGFAWNQNNTFGNKAAKPPTWPLSFVFVDSSDLVITPASGSSSYNGRQASPGNPDNIHYKFNKGDTIRWEIYALSFPADANLELCNLKVPFKLLKDSSSQTPFKDKSFHGPTTWVAATGTKACPNLPGATVGKKHPYWTPPSKDTFVIETEGTYSFSVEFEIRDQRKFSVDPEMITGPADSGGDPPT